MMALVFGTGLPWLLVAVGLWIGYQFVRQNGRILLRLEAIEKRLAGSQIPAKAQAPRGLSVGTVAPDFELPDLAGVRRKLSDFRGSNVLLMFFNPQCGFCTKMAADLAALPIHGDDDRAIPIVVTTGDAEANRKLVEQYRITGPVLLQTQMEVASQFQAQGTPMGYRIDRAGRIASELAVGAEPLLELAAASAPHRHAAGPGNGAASHDGKPDPSLSRSRLNRDGLKAGTPAPEFRLPRLDGGELSLTDYRGERVLLVFSDPDCGPCDELAPQLQQLHGQRRDLNVLVVSRREVDANRAKATKLGLTFPIALQKQWEISLTYAMFATPVGYLIDEQGVLSSDVAVGVGPILALAEEPAQESCEDKSRSEREPAGAI
jgi:peroxiredoxin